METEIGISLLALFATAARLRRVYRNPGQWTELPPRPIESFCSYFHHLGSELVAKDERPCDTRVADPSILVGVQVAAADSGGRNAN
jgi:hypothetical protein